MPKIEFEDLKEQDNKWDLYNPKTKTSMHYKGVGKGKYHLTILTPELANQVSNYVGVESLIRCVQSEDYILMDRIEIFTPCN